MESLIGYILFFLSGLLFGLFGAGGSLITIPILMLFFCISFKFSTLYSLIIVFLISFFGVISSSNSSFYKFKSIGFFGIASLFGVFVSRNFLFEIIPEEILERLFVLFLVTAALLLQFGKKNNQLNKLVKERITFFKKTGLVFQGFLIGNLTGLLGVGGGFLIVPVLIIFQKFNIKEAARASMFLIFLNSWLAIIIDFSNDFFDIHLPLLSFIILFSVIGLLVGKRIQSKLDLKIMHMVFAFFLIIISLFFWFNI